MNNGHHSHGNYRQNMPQHQDVGYQNPQGQRGWREQQPQPQPQQHPLHNGNQALPPGWVEATDPSSGKVYYCNPQTRETKWERPAISNTSANALAPRQSGNSLAASGDRASHQGATQNTRQGQQQVQPQLPPGWVEATDPNSGKVYYCNPHTRETKWERPTSTTPEASTTLRENEGGTNGNGNRSGSQFQNADDGSETSFEKNVTHSGSNQSTSSPDIGTVTGANKLEDDDSHKGDNDHFDELRSVTTGQIAHMIRLQQHQQNAQKLAQSDGERQIQISTIVSSRSTKDSKEQNDGLSQDPSTYVPIQLSLMSSLPSMERTEPGRLDVRMYALREELKKFGYNQSSTQPTHLR